MNLCKGTNALVLQTYEPLSDESDTETASEPETFPEMLADIKANHVTVSSNLKDILPFIIAKHSNEYITSVENITVGQKDNEKWMEHRKGRITASLSHSVLKCNMANLKMDNYIVRSVMGKTIPFSSQATNYGQDMEKVALNQYVDRMKEVHKSFAHEDTGLFVSKTYPYLAASPDGKVTCKCCGVGLVEIKCTFTHRHKSISDIANEENYHITFENNNMRLKRNTSWYTQIQTQLGVCEGSFCDFVFFTLKGLAIERIYFDPEFFQTFQEKAEVFFDKFLLPRY